MCWWDSWSSWYNWGNTTPSTNLGLTVDGQEHADGPVDLLDATSASTVIGYNGYSNYPEVINSVTFAVQGAGPDDELSLNLAGTAYHLTGNGVYSADDVLIATISGGQDGAPLVITPSGTPAASAAALQRFAEVLGCVTYVHEGANAPYSAVVTVTVDNTYQSDQVFTVNVSVTNGASIPTIEFPALDPTPTSDGAQAVTANAYTHQYPDGARLSDGGHVVVWSAIEDADGSYGVYLQRYDADGVAQGGEVRVNTTTASDQHMPTVTALADGGYVVVWQSYGQDGSDWGVYAQRYDADGGAQGGEVLVNTYTTDTQQQPVVTALADGGWLVVWNSGNQDGSGFGVYAQRYDADGAAHGGETLVNTTTMSDQYQPAVAALADGGWVVVWNSYGQDGSSWGVYAQRFDADGVAQGGEARVNTYGTNNQMMPAVTGLADGGYVVVWQSYSQDGDAWGVYAQRYDANGAAQGGELHVSTYTAGNQSDADVTALPDGGFVVAWVSDGQDGSGLGVYAQRFGADGVAVGDEFRVSQAVSGHQYQASVFSTADGFTVVWTDTSSGNYQIMSRDYVLPQPVVDHVGTVDVALNLIWPDSADGSETLTVTLSGFPAGTVFNHGHAGDGGTWVIDIADAAGMAVLDDLTMTPPSSFGGDLTLTAVASTLESSNGATASSAPTQVVIHMISTNSAPAPTDDAVSVGEHGPAATGSVLTNDSDPDATDTLAVTAVNGVAADVGNEVTLASGARLTLNADGTYSYDPNGAFDGLGAGETATDSFTYTVSDGNGGVATATATVTVNGVNDAPTALDHTASATEDGAVVSGSVLGDATDPDVNDSLVVSAVNGSAAGVDQAVTLASGASVTLHADGTYDYAVGGAFQALGEGQTAEDSFTYTVSDGHGGTSTATVTVTVTGTNDAPVATVGTLNATEDAASALTGLSFADDGGPGPYTVTLTAASGKLTATSGSGVTVGGSGTGSVTLTGTMAAINAFVAASGVSFTGAANAAGDVALTVGASDGALSSSTNATIHVSPVNDAPTLTAPGTLQIDENGAHAITGVSFADIDAGSSNVTATFQVGSGTLAATSGSGVTVTGSGTGTVTLTGTTAAINAFVAASGVSFTNAHDNVADVTLTARINDGGNTGSGGALSAQTTVTLDIQTHGTLGSASTDNMAGGKGDDLLRGLGGNDTLSGKNGADQLQGGSGHDTLDGGSGNDVIDAGSGYDRLKGGAGNDTFHWGNDALDGATDHVLDFQKGKDKLDFHDIDANPLLAGDQAFTVVSAFGHHAGEMTVVTTKSDTTIQLDVNGDGLADLTIQIHGKVTPSDWIL